MFHFHTYFNLHQRTWTDVLSSQVSLLEQKQVLEMGKFLSVQDQKERGNLYKLHHAQNL